ncbi:hypothetical protein FHS61_000545 [Altererythrobacter atlanticus]|uniref:Uncharacterized protein n=1 Tax=Croceibacterium atlanticum TaxID=1267766 RepID=A0A0F7KUB5_9SPHN|nr:hypothetical protein [Croceibacterium atlanticum]AKH42771.1 hypothetical protein WYH_01735 [Croceibacterium atlanticum]MBB5731552.1 hypothetical protein [Croceibacterium atlanticum]
MAMPSTPESRRYMRRLSISMAAYMVTLIGGAYLVNNELVSGPLLWLLALLPGLSLVGAFYAVGMFIIEQKDEFLRMLLVRQSLFATAFALSVASIWGFLQEFGLVPDVALYYVAILWFFGLGLGAGFNKLTVGSAGWCW